MKMDRGRVFSLLLVTLLLTSTLFAVGAPVVAEDPQTQSLTEPVVVRLYFTGRDHLDAVAGDLDIWEVDPDQGFAVVALQPAQYDWLQSLGYRLEIDAEKTALLGIQAPLDPRFYYFDDYYTNPNGLYIVDFLQDTETAYPDLTELIDIGDAWIGWDGGYNRDILVLRITNEDPAYGPIEDKPAFYLMANIHAREVATPELAMRYIRYLTEGYNGEGGYDIDPDVTWLVNHNILYVQVTQNPDGHEKNEEDIGNFRRKNLDDDDGCTNPSTLGVDLNRNHSFFWGCCGGSSGDPCGETYRGPSAGSEPETQAFQNYFATVIEDQNGDNGDNELPVAAPITTTGIFISLHQHGDMVLWPWGVDDHGDPPNMPGLTTIGRKLAYHTGYDATGTIYYDVDGATDDWTYGKFGIPSYVYEIGYSSGACGGFFPDYECIDGAPGWSRNFWAETKPSFLFAHKIARTPYMTSYGPDTENVVPAPGAVAPAELVDLTATIADHRYTGDPLQPIDGAEYFIDAPGEDGTGTPMSPSDGSWGDLTEAVEAVVDTTGLALGKHYILVHGQNDDGDWGPFTAAFLYIVDPSISPTIEGYVRDSVTSAPLEATVAADIFEATSDPATGYYSMTVISGTYDVSAFATGYLTSTVAGVEVHDHQIVQQDFELLPSCEVLADDMESGDGYWSHQADEGTDNWSLTTDQSHSPTHAWHVPDDSDITDSYLWNTAPVPMGDGGTLTFWHRYQFESGYDGAVLEISTDGGGNWTDLGPYITANDYNDTLSTSYQNPLGGRDAWSGAQLTWTKVAVDLSSFAGQDAQIRWRVGCDTNIGDVGWYIDDVIVQASGSACVPTVSPTAEFTSNSPVTLGNPMIFTNQTIGSLPMDFSWDFGDGIGTSAVRDPQYTYLTTGTFVVTLNATNTLGADSVSHPVVVLEEGACISLTEVTIEGDAAGEPGIFTFTTSYEPPSASPPVTYLWDSGETVDTSVRSLDVGIHTLTVTATNCIDTFVTDTHTIVISAAPVFNIYLPVILSSG